jgi:type I restriction enzyme S subunit
MQSDVFMERAKEISVGSLSPTINWKTLAKEVFVLPPLAQQGQIQRVLSRSRTALETLRTSSSRLLDLRRSMQNELLFRSPRSGHGRTVLLSELAQIDPSDRPLEEDAPFVPMDAVTEWQRTIDRFEQRGSRAGARASAGDVLMARITPCLENGKIAQVPDNVSRCGGSTEFIVLRALPETDRSYLYWLISSDRIRNAAVAMMSGSTGRQRVSGADIGGVRVPQIDSAKQIELGRLIDSVDEDRKALLVRVEEAAQFNSGMVNTMIGGRGS